MARILDMDKKYQIILIVLLLCFLLIVFTTVGASLFSGNKDKFDDVAYINTDNGLTINYTHGTDIKYNKKNNVTYGVTITNTTKSKLFYSIELNIYSLSDDAILDIVDYDGNVVKSVKLDDKFNGKLYNLQPINPNEILRYNIIFKNKQRTKMDAKLTVINESSSSENFGYVLFKNFTPGDAQSRIGSEISTKDEGIISTVDNRGTAYFFRGDVKNNYVKVGNYMFRIVRINGDETIRLVMEDSIGDYAFNLNQLQYGAYANTLVDFSLTTIATELNNWLNENLIDYNNYLVEGDYCTDMDFSYVINESYYSRAYERMYKENAPVLNCTTMYKGKIGLLSADEVVYAGAYRNSINDNYYLYNEKLEDGYLTMTGLFYNNSMTVMNVNGNGSLGDGLKITEKAAIRPVITLSTGARVNGSGTIDDPFVVVA